MGMADWEVAMAHSQDAERLRARVAEMERFVREFLLYFTSSNSIPVERATIKGDAEIVQWARLLLKD